MVEERETDPSTQATVPTLSPVVVSSEAGLSLGTLVSGTYELVSVLGRGGMATVYEAHDHVLGRRVALKVAHLGVRTEALDHEGRALAVLHHAGVPALYAAGVHEGHRYLVMELLHGRTLEERIDETLAHGHRFEIAEVVDTLRKIAEALAAAHEVGIAHRDLKPSNVMVCGARLVLVDFGLFVPEYDAERDPHVVGSIEYMAPEVLTKSVRSGEGPAIDLYALGVVGFELLVGRTPYGTSSPSKVVTGHVLGEIPDVRDHRVDVPAALAHLLHGLLEKHPRDRPPGADVVVRALGDVARALAATPSVAPSRPLRVVIVDDDAEVLHILGRSLRAARGGLDVHTFTEPADALEHVDRTHTDVVLLDLEMPAMNGIELTMALMALPPLHRPRVVALSAQADERDVAVFRALGVWDYVPKDTHFVSAVLRLLGDLQRMS